MLHGILTGSVLFTKTTWDVTRINPLTSVKKGRRNVRESVFCFGAIECFDYFLHESDFRYFVYSNIAK